MEKRALPVDTLHIQGDKCLGMVTVGPLICTAGEINIIYLCDIIIIVQYLMDLLFIPIQLSLSDLLLMPIQRFTHLIPVLL